MTLLRLLPIVFLFLSTTVLAQHNPFSSSHDSKWYVGFGVGKANPKLLLDETINEVTLEIPDELGRGEVTLPISVNSEFVTYGQKLFVGYDVGKEKRWALEGALLNFGKYKGKAKTTVSVSGTTLEDIPYTLSGEGEEEVTANIYGLTFSSIYSFPLGKRFSIFPRIGVSYVKGSITVQERVNITVGMLGQFETDAEIKRKNNSLEGWLPTIGVGVDFQLTERSFLRAEFERHGHPTKEPYIDMWFVNWGYRFK